MLTSLLYFILICQILSYLLSPSHEGIFVKNKQKYLGNWVGNFSPINCQIDTNQIKAEGANNFKMNFFLSQAWCRFSLLSPLVGY